MKKSHIAILPILLLAAAACNGGDDGLSENQQAAADQFLAQEGASDVFDRDCVEEKAKELSDEDAQALTDAGPDGDPELSAEGTALTIELASCVDTDALIVFVVEGLVEAGQQFDEGCVREKLADIDMNAVANDPTGEATEEMFSSLNDCVELDSGG